MRRPLALSLIVLGIVVTLVGGTGLFAPFTDRATTGVNSITTGERPRAADLQLAWAVPGPFDCDTATYSDNPTTPGHTATDAQPGFVDNKFFCLRNAGSSALDVSVAVIDRSDVEVGCTGDEAAAGDASCGSAGGEAGDVLHVNYVLIDCDTGSGPGSTPLGFLSVNPSAALGSLAAGETWCGRLQVNYPLNIGLESQLVSQSDQVTWKYAFDGTT